MSDQTANEPEEQNDIWLRRQLAAAVGPPDIGEMSDAQLERMLHACGDETYTPEQLERLVARFWIEASQLPATTSDDTATPLGVPAARRFAVAKADLSAAETAAPQSLSAAETAAPQALSVAEMAAPQTPTLFIPPSLADVPKEALPVVSLRSAVGFFSEYTPLLGLAAAVVAGFFLAFNFPASRHTDIAVSRPAVAERSQLRLVEVGHISGMLDCSFAAGGQAVEQQEVRVGQRLELDRGLLEITYDAGAKVILRGPATYTVESARGGFLAVGKLTATVEGDRPMPNTNSDKAAFKFVLRTPSVTVNDLGTEFGVEVKPDAVTEVCVFRGEVLAVRDGPPSPQRIYERRAPVRERLVAGEAIRFASTDTLPQRTTVESLGTAPLLSPGKVRLLTRDARQAELLAPNGLVATAYHRVWDAHGYMVNLGDRRHAFHVASDGIFGRGQQGEGPRSSFDTLAATDPPTDFVGLTYSERVRIDRIKVFMGHQFADGGSWGKPPRVFILVSAVETDSTPPERNPSDWRELPPLQVSYGTPFDTQAGANPGEVMEFVLTGYPAEHRTGYGWAIGGRQGNGSASYVSITELRAYGAKSEPADD